MMTATMIAPTIRRRITAMPMKMRDRPTTSRSCASAIALFASWDSRARSPPRYLPRYRKQLIEEEQRQRRP